MLAAATRLLTLTKGRSAEYEGEPAAVPRSLFTIGLAGLGLGVLTGIFGIGGGFLVVPALVGLLHLPAGTAASISFWVIAVNAFAGLVGHAADSAIAWEAASILTLGAVIGVVPGLLFKFRLPAVILRRSFATILLVIGVVLGWQRFIGGW
jgi:hypothetical protein